MRARNLKPGFFKNDLLAECSFPARLLFAGLWCLADREGRLEDRPKRIKGELFAFDNVDIDQLLAELESRGFIIRYVANGLQCIAIPKFSVNQRPHQNEVASSLPPPNPEALRTKVASASHQGSKHFALNPSSLNPSSLNPCIAADAATAAKTKSGKPRPRDELFDAVAEVGCADPEVNGPVIGKVCAALRRAKPPYTPEEVRRLPAAWAAAGMTVALTVPAIEKHIARVRRQSVRPGDKPRSEIDAEKERTRRQLEEDEAHMRNGEVKR
jgi:hypothetical protein